MRQDFEDQPARQRHIKTITLSTVTSVLAICGILMPVAGLLFTPAIVDYLSAAMAGEIRGQVQEQVTPVNAGMKALIENNIAELEDEISAMEYTSATQPQHFTALDASMLTTKKRRLRGQQAALQAIIEAERARQK